MRSLPEKGGRDLWGEKIILAERREGDDIRMACMGKEKGSEEGEITMPSSF